MCFQGASQISLAVKSVTSLERLGKAALAGILDSAVKMELILMQDEPATMSASGQEVLLGNLTPDKVAQGLSQITGMRLTLYFISSVI